MKKNYLLLIFLILNEDSVNAQFTQYCTGTRFDTEVFQQVNVTSNVVYGSNTGNGGGVTTLEMDIYEPVGDTLAVRPLIIWVHGGSFVGGTKNDVDVVSLSEHFARRGYVCASINYRLGFSTFPPTAAVARQTVYMAMQDMKAAVRFFRKDAATVNSYKIDPNVIFGGGSSAGAFTALHLAYLDQYSEVIPDIDTAVFGDLEGNSGNSGYSSSINAVIDLCGALGDKTYMQTGDIPFVAMHGDNDGTVPYATATIYLLGIFPIMVIDGSYSVAQHANTIGVHNEFYTYFGADHVPYASSNAYMDTTVRFVSNFLYRYFGCTPSDPLPVANSFNTGVEYVDGDNFISIYPNPGDGIFTFEVSRLSSVDKLSIFDVGGRKLLQLYPMNDRFYVDLSGLSSGIYFYSIQGDGRLYKGKLLKK
jgi:hypothetical protein